MKSNNYILNNGRQYEALFAQYISEVLKIIIFFTEVDTGNA